MANKITKKGRNPGAVDNWLDTLGLAVSEQLFDCQIYHERVRTDCITYAKSNFPEFSHLVEVEENWHEHLNLLKKHMVVCGHIEINIISRKYNRDIIIFDATRQQIFEVTKRNLPNSLLLCLMDEDHYDVVYKREHIVTAGFCQCNLHIIFIRYQIVPAAEILAEKKKMMAEVNNNEMGLEPLEEETDNSTPLISLTTNIAPFPFKVAKALDPTIYRNIEYDSWGEVRREMRLGDWYYGDDKLILGTRCILNDTQRDETYDCYIQEIIKDQNKCVVYLTKLAERRTIFQKSSNSRITTATPIEKVSKNIKKRNKEKRRTKSCSESSAISNVVGTSEAVENVNAYVGIPLQMHNPNDNYHHQEVSAETQTEPIPQETIIITPDAQTGPNRYQWDQTHWHTYLPPTPDPFVWPQTPATPQSMFNYNLKPMVASAPVTPDVVPYHGKRQAQKFVILCTLSKGALDNPNFPFYYNYHVDPYPHYGQWAQPSSEFHPSPLKSDPDKTLDDSRSQTTQTETGHYQYTQNENNYDPQTTVSPSHERSTLCTTLTPQNTPVEVYSPMISIPPGTPVIYAAAPEMTEMMMPTTPIMYTPPVDMQYVSPGPYVYPPTPPAAWYPAGVNSHGFIFPPRP
ncbi:hypothetical protein NQ314_006848 [Rhamnusium bicolor]|uniref:OTU domain-containing protein n=1 Tax=Rhamnusium bicolor TaxID=1586634 RepID=A0AAV8YWP5_9CUCU|nr:hypothetical protein NQ314_006848 [Rhamnusium bicolor]